MNKVKQSAQLGRFGNVYFKNVIIVSAGRKDMLFWKPSPSFTLIFSQHRSYASDSGIALIMYHKSSNGGQESGSLFPEAICFSSAARAQFKIIFNMNEKLEPLEQADGVLFSSPQTINLSASFFKVHSSSCLLFCLTLFCHSFQLLCLVYPFRVS